MGFIMKRFFIVLCLGIASVVSCTQNQTPAQPDAGVLAVGDSTAKCTVKDIFDCTTSAGGLTCFDRCGFSPSDKFCNMEKLDKCLDAKGGNPCYKKYCGASAHSGPFTPPGGTGLVQLPSQGYGYQTFDVEWMRFGKPKTIARIKELAIRVYNKTGKKIFVGDLSNSSGGNGGRHAGHYDGIEVDIAVMGNTPTVNCYTIWEGCYLRSASIVLIGEIRAMGGASGVLFNDSAVRSRFPGFVSFAGGHDNHYHVNWHY